MVAFTSPINRLRKLFTKDTVVSRRARRFFINEYLERDTRIKDQGYELISKPFSEKSLDYDDTNLTLTGVDYSDEVYKVIIDFLSQVEAVVKIILISEGTTLHIWSVLAGHDKTIRERVYEKEREIIVRLSKADLHFDFYLAEPEEVDEILSSGGVIIYQK